MIKTTIIILCVSLISLVVGVFVGYRINPIKGETIEEIENVTNSLDGISAINSVDMNLLQTRSFVSIIIGILEHLKNDDKESAVTVASSSLNDIYSELTRDLEANSLTEEKRILVKLIEPYLVNINKTKER